MNQPLQETVPKNVTPEEAVVTMDGSAKQLEDSCAEMRVDVVERKHAPAERFERAQHKRNVHQFVLPDGDTLKDAVEQDYWVHIAQKLTVLDRIEIVPDDGSFYAELMVRSLQFGMVVTGVINDVRFDEYSEDRPEAQQNYRVEFKGPHEKYCVFQQDQLLISKLETQGVADRWLANHRKAQV